MEQKFKRLEQHLYERRYETSKGERRILYYALFRDRLKGKARKYRLRSDLKLAKEDLKILEARNIQREDFDAENIATEQEPKKNTLSDFMPRILNIKSGIKSFETYKTYCRHLERVLGNDALEDITTMRIMEYKNIRLAEPIIRYGKPSEKGLTPKASTVNRELGAIKEILYLAVEEKLIGSAPRKTGREPEKQFRRDRILSQEEYLRLQAASPPWLRRLCVAAYETCIPQGQLLALSRDEVKRIGPGAAVIKPGGGVRQKTGEKQRVPVSPEMAGILKDTDGKTGPIFTRDGAAIDRNALGKAFHAAKKRAGIEDFHFHDFRRCAITRWVVAGIPGGPRRLASGHSQRDIHESVYLNPSDIELFQVFARYMGWEILPPVKTGTF